jgi:HEAT repeat protein
MKNRSFPIFFPGLLALLLIAAGPATADDANQQLIDQALGELQNDDPAVRYHAAMRLGGQVDPPKRVINSLIDAMADTDFRVRANAAAALGNYGPHAARSAEVLVSALNDSDRRVCDGSAVALGKMGRAVVPHLCGVLDHEKKDVKIYAIEALGNNGPEAVEGVTALTGKFSDADPVIRLKVIWALSRIGPAAVPGLVPALENESAVSRWYAATALGRIGSDAETVVPALVRRLQDEDYRVRQAAARELAHFRPLDESVINALVAAIGDTSSAVSFNATLTLGGSGRPAVPPLIRYLMNESAAHRNQAVRALGLIGPDAREAVDILEKISLDRHKDLKHDVTWALKKVSARAINHLSVPAE